MRRIRLTGLARLAALALLAAALPGAVAAQADGRAAPGPSPRAVLKDLVCQTALDPPARAVDVTAVMRPVTGTVRMAVQFVLLQRPAGALGFSSVAGPGLGSWVAPSDPTLGRRAADVWIIKHPVADLDAPAAYRIQVTFRWTGAKGRVLGMMVRTSRSCQQPELRPDLVVQGVSVSSDPSHPALDNYLVTLANTGASAAGPFTLQLADGSVVKDKTINRLGPRTSRTFQFTGPACDASSPPTVTADPSDQVDVSSRSGASLAVSCPGEAAAPGGGAAAA
jgi:hypothetical protein